MKFETKAIHCGQAPDESTGAIITPIYQTSTYVQTAIGKNKGYEYSRVGNPTRTALEENITALEEGKYGFAFASGMAAMNTVMNLLKLGAHIVVSNNLYGGTYRLFTEVYVNYGLTFDFVDALNPDNIAKAINKKTKLIWLETPTNPLLKILDIKKIAGIAKSNNCLLVVDNTFATPYLQQPLKLGADIVVHSTTKYLGGHSDIIGGAIVIKDKDCYNKLAFYQKTVGGVPGPFDCWLVLRGIKTLALRMDRHNENALVIARYLEKHSKVEKVYYPGLPSHPQYELAKKQMSGFGGIVSFELKSDIETTKKFVSLTKYFSLAGSLGGVESLIEHPASMSHASIPKEKRLEVGLTDKLIRLSVGIENVEDLLEGLEQAMSKISCKK